MQINSISQNINVKNLSADLIQNGILKLGKNQGSATNTGEVELYNETVTLKASSAATTK